MLPYSLTRQLWGQLVAAFGTSSGYYSSTATGRHTRSKPMLPLTSNVTRLICPFHEAAFYIPMIGVRSEIKTL